MILKAVSLTGPELGRAEVLPRFAERTFLAPGRAVRFYRCGASHRTAAQCYPQASVNVLAFDCNTEALCALRRKLLVGTGRRFE